MATSSAVPVAGETGGAVVPLPVAEVGSIVDAFPSAAGWIATFAEAEREEEWLIDGLLPATITLVVGKKGFGKTTYLQAMVDALRKPESCDWMFHGFPIRRKVERVLWFCTDAGEESARRKAFGDDTDNDDVGVYHLNADTHSTSYWAALSEWITKTFGPDLIVIDHTGGLSYESQNDDTTVNAVLGAVKKLRLPTVLAHHAAERTKDTARPLAMGHTQWTANARSVIRIAKVKGSPVARQLWVEPNRATPSQVVVDIDFAGGTVRESAFVQTVPGVKKRSTESVRVARLGAIAARLGVTNETSVADAVRRLTSPEVSNEVKVAWELAAPPSAQAIKTAIGRRGSEWTRALAPSDAHSSAKQQDVTKAETTFVAL